MRTTKCVAEFLGTFWLVLGGCGSAVLAAAFPYAATPEKTVNFYWGSSECPWPSA
jgi:aquaporin Z